MERTFTAASRRLVTCNHLKRSLPSRPRAVSALLHTAPHRTRPLRKPKRQWCECQVKQREDRPGERRARAAGRAASWHRGQHGGVPAETSSGMSAAVLVGDEPRRTGGRTKATRRNGRAGVGKCPPAVLARNFYMGPRRFPFLSIISLRIPSPI